LGAVVRRIAAIFLEAAFIAAALLIVAVVLVDNIMIVCWVLGCFAEQKN